MPNDFPEPDPEKLKQSTTTLLAFPALYSVDQLRAHLFQLALHTDSMLEFVLGDHYRCVERRSLSAGVIQGFTHGSVTGWFERIYTTDTGRRIIRVNLLGTSSDGCSYPPTYRAIELANRQSPYNADYARDFIDRLTAVHDALLSQPSLEQRLQHNV